jgi:hypothetical protein
MKFSWQILSQNMCLYITQFLVIRVYAIYL